jgi:hypothetical protein
VDGLSSTAGAVALAACAVAVVALVVAAVALVRLRRLRADQRALLGGDRPATDLVEHAARIEEEFRALHAYVGEVVSRIDGRLGLAEARHDGAIAYRGLVRFDAFDEPSGRQSSAIALLDATRSGVVLTNISRRDQARLYVKHIVDGRGEFELAPEEQEAIRVALAGEPPPSVTEP